MTTSSVSIKQSPELVAKAIRGSPAELRAMLEAGLNPNAEYTPVYNIVDMALLNADMGLDSSAQEKLDILYWAGGKTKSYKPLEETTGRESSQALQRFVYHIWIDG